MTDTDAIIIATSDIATNDIATNLVYLTNNVQLIVYMAVFTMGIWFTVLLVKYIRSIWTDFMN